MMTGSPAASVALGVKLSDRLEHQPAPRRLAPLLEPRAAVIEEGLVLPRLGIGAEGALAGGEEGHVALRAAVGRAAQVSDRTRDEALRM